MEAIAEGKKEFRRFRKKAFLITGKNADSGDPFQLLMSYVRMVFHVDILAYNSLLKEIKDKADTIMLLIDNIGGTGRAGFHSFFSPDTVTLEHTRVYALVRGI